MTLSEVLCEAGEPTRYVYFPIGGFISLLAEVDGERVLEVGMIGREGMLGVQLAVGVREQPLRAIVQGSGTALRIGEASFRRELAGSAALRSTLSSYLYLLLIQHAGAAACIRYHTIEPRLARWLLMTHDRAGTPSFHVTQEFLAYMLGVRRVGVTHAATRLQQRGLITYARGEITVVDRPGLEAAACTCYAKDRSAYAAQLA